MSKSPTTTLLAYVGDAVYELWIRKMLVQRKNTTHVDKLHRAATAYVSAHGQSAAVKEMMKDFLTEDEVRLVKRARNHRTSSHPRGADPREYKLATGMEALAGSLYLSGDTGRLDEVMNEAVRVIDEKYRERQEHKAREEQ